MVPPTTIARVFSEVSFSKENTRITSSAVALSAEYIRLFVREAILRANAQRLAEDAPTGIDGIDNVAVDANLSDTLGEFAGAKSPLDGGDDGEDQHEDIDEDLDLDEIEEEEAYEDRGSGLSTQIPPPSDANDVLTTRHLTAVSGLLVMDF